MTETNLSSHDEISADRDREKSYYRANPERQRVEYWSHTLECWHQVVTRVIPAGAAVLSFDDTWAEPTLYTNVMEIEYESLNEEADRGNPEGSTEDGQGSSGE